MKILLAPMEGLVDAPMRAILTGIGGIDLCITEFVRVTDQVLPRRVFVRYCPELLNGCRTTSGVPVRIQLLGGQPQAMAGNARKAVKLGSPGVDLNFGCPAKTVNKNDGGAKLLVSPHRLYDIVHAVRGVVPEDQPVTAKMRLGYEDKSLALENALALEAGGAQIITVHARTKLEGYHPPAHWEWIARIREQVRVPVVANGDIWTEQDYQRCLDVTGCKDVMIGRGLIRFPDLARRIRARQQGNGLPQADWHWHLQQVMGFYQLMENDPPKAVTGRLKQWLGLLALGHTEGAQLFQEIKRLRRPDEIIAQIQQMQINSPLRLSGSAAL